jgi:poly(A) polymerase
MSLFQDQLRHDFQWTRLFEPFPYAANYQQFLRIGLCAPTSEELRDWAGWVKCRNLILRVLLLHLLFFLHALAAY